MMRPRFLISLFRDESGQAIVEYILGLSIAVVVVGTIATVFRKSLFGFWEVISRDVSAACPGCPPEQRIRIAR